MVGEENFISQCPYCLREAKPTHANKWRSEFNREIHYKALRCSCGKDLRIKVSFQGSGHDNWNKKKKTIEDKVKVIKKFEIVD